MGSLRSPVGPLPSSIYWRRRAVALTLVALLALLAVWAVNFGGSGRTDDQGQGAPGNGPAPSITPGPSSSGPAISGRPGGRDETEGGASGGGAGTGEEAGGKNNGADGSSGAGTEGGSAGAGGVPAGSKLPDCTSGAVELTLRSVRNSYAPDEKPKFELIAKNSSSHDCKVDFSRKGAVLTITFTSDGEQIWASDDCPDDGGQVLLNVPAKSETARTVEWDREPSEPKCATPSAGPAGAGTYLVEAKVDGLPTARVSFSLKKD